MGFIRDQASSSTCKITGLIPAPGTPIPRRQRPRHAAPDAPPVAEIKEGCTYSVAASRLRFLFTRRSPLSPAEPAAINL